MASQAPMGNSQMSYKVAGTLIGSYKIQSGDTFSGIASREGFDLNAVLAANPDIEANDLEVGQVINLPIKTLALVFNLSDVARILGTSVQDLHSDNPGMSSEISINKVIKGPSPLSRGEQVMAQQLAASLPGGSGGGNGGGGYANYSGPASSFPHTSQWASYSALWNSNSKLMKYHDSDAEIADIKTAIETVARESQVDVRVVLCTIMQESGGNVRVRTTVSPDGTVRNPGIMQSHNGAEFNPLHAAQSILQMVRDGIEGTKSGDGLKQCFHHQGNWYAALREYNSGRVNVNDLNDGMGATGSYVRDVANRLMGHVWNNM
ncbi:uncharacterized protein A1O5_03329 [Cladophialophora psammophila CBS 110553]|uniref:LysM domain-containing protein n=1 Tax=Cladophialophora psammophila CBS 110553 TaxID=1182543 RepID=W9X042_9EURO|nr:uncharacterized protein A1O5_03329 [Cladophialophora psammophila CBS 110553]EXJ73568.1 hypothetical protein A1O5_03329 [Cladophialophora psammophila CBS 110553]